MIVLCGRTCAGKDTFGKKLEEDFGFTKIISYTTRPPREGEIDGKDYYFISNEIFNKHVKNGYFAEKTEYKQENGDIWRYGTAYAWYINSDADKGYVILNPEGINQLIKLNLDFHIFFLNESHEPTLRDRYILRGGTEEKFKTRYAQDKKDFTKFDKDYDPIAKWLKDDKEGKRSFVSINRYIKSSVKYYLEKWGCYIEMPGYGKRTRADMWEEIQKLKEACETEKGKVRSLETTIVQREYKIDCLEKELAARVKDLNYELSQKNKDGKVIFRDLRRLFDTNTIDVINFYNKDNATYIFSISELGFSNYLTNRSRIELDGFEVLGIRPYFIKDRVNLDVILDIKEDK